MALAATPLSARHIFLAAVLIAMLLFSGEPWWDDAHTRLIISTAFGFFVLLVFTFDPLFSSLLVRRRARSGTYRAYLQRIRIELDATTLRATNVRSGETQEWRAIRGIQLSRIGCVVHLAPAHALMFPKRPFATEADFMAFLTKVNQLPRERVGKP
jgi:hypothetical protein